MHYLESTLKALANHRRLEILKVLHKHKKASVGYIADAIDLSIHATSKHLGILEHTEIVEYYEDGNFRIYTLRKHLDPVAKYVIGQA